MINKGRSKKYDILNIIKKPEHESCSGFFNNVYNVFNVFNISRGSP